MKKLIITSLIATGLIYFTSCEKVDNSMVSISEVEDVITNLEGSSLATATYEGSQIPLRPIYHASSMSSVSRSVRSSNDNFTLQTQIASPTNANGDLLSASFVELYDFNDNNKTIAYVTYNLQGADHGGALLVVDLSTATKPRIIKEVIFEGIDINVCEISEDGEYLWLGGSSFARGAVVIPVTLKTNGDIENDNAYDLITVKNVASINGIIQTDEWLMVTAGNTGGGTFALNYEKGYRLDGSDSFSNAKFSTCNGKSNGNTHISLEGGTKAKLHVYTIGTADENLEPIISIGSIYHQNVADSTAGKATCYIEEGEDICYVAMGANGFIAIDINRKTQVMHSNDDILTTGNTNGICVDEKYIYLANGADGVVFCRKPEISDNMSDFEVSPTFIWDDDLGSASANYVTSKGDYIFVAKGANGGLSVLKRDN